MMVMPFGRLRNAIDSCWAKSKSFRFLVIAACFLLCSFIGFLIWYIFHDYILTSLIILSALVAAASKKGYGKRRQQPAQ